MRGGPSHVDTFDHKPKLSAKSGAPGTRPGTKLLGSKWQFAQHGQSGLWISERFPQAALLADTDLERLFACHCRADEARSGSGHVGLGLSLAKACAGVCGLDLTASRDGGRLTFILAPSSEGRCGLLNR